MAIGGGGGGGSNNIKAGAAYVELWVKNNLGKGLDAAAAEVKAFGKHVAGFGASLAKAGTAGLVGLGATFVGAVKRGAEFDAIAKRLGDSAENLSAFAYAAGTANVPLEQLLDNWENWPDRLTKAATGTDELSEKFRALGINAEEMKKKPIVQQMLDLADAMKKVTNNSDRLALLGELFSDKGQGFNELFKKGPEAIRALMAEAKDLGAVVTTEQGEQARRVERAWGRAWTAVKNSVLSVGDALLPTADAIELLGRQISDAAKAAREWVGRNRELVLGAGLLAGGVTVVGVGLMAVAPITAAVAAAWTGATTVMGVSWSALTGVVATGQAIMTGGLGAVAAAVVAIPAGLAVAGAAWLAFTTQGRDTVRGWAAAVRESLGPTIDNLASGFSAVAEAVRQGDLESAFKIAIGTLEIEWLRFTQYLERMWLEFTLKFDNMWAAATRTLGLFAKGARAIGFLPKEQPPGAAAPAAGADGPPAGPNRAERAAAVVFNPLFEAARDFLDNDPNGQKLKGKFDQIKGEMNGAVNGLVGQILDNVKKFGDDMDKMKGEHKKEMDEAKKRLDDEKKRVAQRGLASDLASFVSGNVLAGTAWLKKNFNAEEDVFGKKAIGAGEVRAVLGGDASRNFLGVGGANPVERIGNRVAGRLEDLAGLAEAANKLLTMIEAKTGTRFA